MNPSGEPIQIFTDVSVVMSFAFENVSTDPLGRVTLHNLVDQLNAVSFPTTTPMLFCVFGFYRKTAGFLMQCKVQIMPPEGEPLMSQAIQDMSFTPAQPMQRAIVGFQSLIWPKPGEYTVRFMSREQTITSFPLRVNQVQLPPNQPR